MTAVVTGLPDWFRHPELSDLGRAVLADGPLPPLPPLTPPWDKPPWG